jgi:hypothetical protein
VAETARQASAELRKKAAPAKQKRLKKQQAEAPDRSALVNRFGPNGNLATGLDQYNRYVLLEKDSQTGDQYVRYLYVNPNGTDWEVLNGTDIIKRVKSTYKDQEALRNSLYNKGFLTKREYVSKSTSALNGAIIEAATEFSTEVADSFTTEGKIKFPTFDSWMAGRGSTAGDGSGSSGGPRRDIQKYDRDVIRQMVIDAYLDSPNANLPDESIIQRDTDYYMKMANEGVLTTTKKKNAKGEYQVTSTPGFSEQRLRDEIRTKRKTEFAGDESVRNDLDFLAFLAQLEG